MKSITDYMVRLQELTQQNLDILSAINDSFFTKHDHLTVGVGENQYVIPSFLTLENKINSLQANFDNLVHAPETGEAFFTMDGNSRSIEVRKYESVPNGISLNPVEEFGYEQNNIFKDFVTPVPFINLNLQSLPNDITQVLVKKVIPLSQELKSLFRSYLFDKIDTKTQQNLYHKSVQYHYKDLYKVLSGYVKDEDYIEYDTRLNLPVRKNIGTATYVIEKIVKDWVDDNLINFITLKLRSDLTDPIYSNNLKYRLFDETIEVPLKIGDQLVTYEGNAKMEITNIQTNLNTITVKVLHGEFLNLVESPNTITDLSKIRFHSPIDFDNDKYIKVPMEEDQLIFISVSPLNNRMNVQAPWGTGLVIDTYSLTNGNQKFENYYKENVRNVGDILFEMTSVMSNTLTKYTESEYNEMSKLVPIIDKSNLIVTQINSHLNDSESVKNLRTLYTQKKQYQQRLNNVREEIIDLTSKLTSTSFENTSGIKQIYEDQIRSLRNEETELLTSINKLINDIAISANNSEIPLENAKYRIRGFFDYQKFLGGSYLKDHVKGIRLQYRYKNVNREQGSAFTINDKFVFSDWNNMSSFDLQRIPSYNDGYKFNNEQNNDGKNEPSFNQIDIPISQGETVDIRLKLVYDFGAPFIETSSSWSDIVNIEFPQEFLQNVSVVSIIDENEKERESDKFKSILNQEGVTKHVQSSLQDQDILYYHRADDIASGFYTQERRIIPLKDKLIDIDKIVQGLCDEVAGQNSHNLKVSISHGSSIYDLQPYKVNNISVLPYGEIFDNRTSIDGYEFNKTTDVATTVFSIVLRNESDYSMKLFSLCPGNRNVMIHNLTNTRISKNELNESYQPSNKYGVWIEYTENGEERTYPAAKLQCGNQYIYFRINDINDGAKFYTDTDDLSKMGSLLSLKSDAYKPSEENKPEASAAAWMYPKVQDKYGLQFDDDSVGSYLVLNAHEELIIPVVYSYYFDGQNKYNTTISKTMSFEVKTSLYRDPVVYTFKVNSKYNATSTDKAINYVRSARQNFNIIQPKKYTPVVK